MRLFKLRVLRCLVIALVLCVFGALGLAWTIHAGGTVRR